MAAVSGYPVSRINSRRRASRQEMNERAIFLLAYAAEHGPVTVRGPFYRAGIEGPPGIDKTKRGYDKVQRQVLLLRRNGALAYRHIADLTRWMRKPRSYDSVEAALQATAEFYRKALWRDAEVYCEVWCEKDALAGVIYPVTAVYDVPLMVARGFASETFCFEAVEARGNDPRPYIVYYLGDFDRAGRDAAASLRHKLERFAAEKGLRIGFVHLAIEATNIAAFDPETGLAHVVLGDGRTGETILDRWLPTREPKRVAKVDQAWPHPFALELDAIEPDDLRALVRWAIEQHLPAAELEILMIAERSEREQIHAFVGKLTPT